MELLHLEGTGSTPNVNLDPQTRNLELSGYSRPENVRDFYDPILTWLAHYKTDLEDLRDSGKETPATVANFRMVYFNSSSAKFICDIIIMLRELHKSGFDISINWHYDESDTEMFEAGEELSDMSDFPFSFIPYE